MLHKNEWYNAQTIKPTDNKNYPVYLCSLSEDGEVEPEGFLETARLENGKWRFSVSLEHDLEFDDEDQWRVAKWFNILYPNE